MKKYLPILKNSPFFTGLTDNEILSILHCVKATAVSQKRDSYIFRAGDSTEVMGLVVSGCVLVMQEDLWGHRNILSKCHAGDFFGEPYAASLGAVLNISVAADEDCEIIFLNVQRLLVTCQTACEHHQKLIRNLVSVLANKILILNDKITHVGKRTTRDNYCHICRQNPSDIRRYLLIFPLTGSSWQIIFALTVRQCLRRYQSYKKKAL